MVFILMCLLVPAGMTAEQPAKREHNQGQRPSHSNSNQEHQRQSQDRERQERPKQDTKPTQERQRQEQPASRPAQASAAPSAAQKQAMQNSARQDQERAKQSIERNIQPKKQAVQNAARQDREQSKPNTPKQPVHTTPVNNISQPTKPTQPANTVRPTQPTQQNKPNVPTNNSTPQTKPNHPNNAQNRPTHGNNFSQPTRPVKDNFDRPHQGQTKFQAEQERAQHEHERKKAEETRKNTHMPVRRHTEKYIEKHKPTVNSSFYFSTTFGTPYYYEDFYYDNYYYGNYYQPVNYNTTYILPAQNTDYSSFSAYQNQTTPAVYHQNPYGTPQFELIFTERADNDLEYLETNSALVNKMDAVYAILNYLEVNPANSELHTQKVNLLAQIQGVTIYETYAENPEIFPDAYKIFWHYGHEGNAITIVAISSRL